MAQFKVGDVVMLKSGGPKMAVAKLIQTDQGYSVKCTWFVDGKALEDNFPEETLQASSPATMPS